MKDFKLLAILKFVRDQLSMIHGKKQSIIIVTVDMTEGEIAESIEEKGDFKFNSYCYANLPDEVVAYTLASVANSLVDGYEDNGYLREIGKDFPDTIGTA